MILVTIMVSSIFTRTAVALENSKAHTLDFIHYGAEVSAKWAAEHPRLADFVNQSELSGERKSEILGFFKARGILNSPPPEFRPTERGFLWITPGASRAVEFFDTHSVRAKIDGTTVELGPQRPFSNLYLELEKKFGSTGRGRHALWLGAALPAAHAQAGEMISGMIGWLGARLTATADWISSCKSSDRAARCTAYVLKKKLDMPETLSRFQCANGQLTYVQRLSRQGYPIGMKLTHDSSGHPSGYQSYAESWGSGLGQRLCQYSFANDGKVTTSKTGGNSNEIGACQKIGSDIEEAARFPVRLMEDCCHDTSKECENEMNGWINTLWKDKEKPPAPHWSPPSQQDPDPADSDTPGVS